MRGARHHKKPRTPSDQMERKRDTLLGTLTACAQHDKVCPTTRDLAALLRVHTTTVKDMLIDLRTAGKITWTIPYCGTGLGKVRVVTVRATGKTTATPKFQPRKKGKPGPQPLAFTPKEGGCPVRILRPGMPEFEKRVAELEARDRQIARHRAAFQY